MITARSPRRRKEQEMSWTGTWRRAWSYGSFATS
jgi:hypothetical protein